MSDIREAFRRGAEQNPKSPITEDVRSTTRQIRREKEVEKIGQKFHRLGREWFNLKINPYHPARSIDRITSTQELRRQWQELLGSLIYFENVEQPQMFNQLANGLQFSEEKINPSYIDFASKTMLENLANEFKAIFRGVRFSPASQLFFEALYDIAQFSEDEKIAFKNFMYQRDGFKGLVRLPQIFPVVAQWFVKKA